jgi:hypothetical protein
MKWLARGVDRQIAEGLLAKTLTKSNLSTAAELIFVAANCARRLGLRRS